MHINLDLKRHKCSLFLVRHSGVDRQVKQLNHTNYSALVLALISSLILLGCGKSTPDEVVPGKTLVLPIAEISGLTGKGRSSIPILEFVGELKVTPITLKKDNGDSIDWTVSEVSSVPEETWGKALDQNSPISIYAGLREAVHTVNIQFVVDKNSEVVDQELTVKVEAQIDFAVPTQPPKYQKSGLHKGGIVKGSTSVRIERLSVNGLFDLNVLDEDEIFDANVMSVVNVVLIVLGILIGIIVIFVIGLEKIATWFINFLIIGILYLIVSGKISEFF